MHQSIFLGCQFDICIRSDDGYSTKMLLSSSSLSFLTSTASSSSVSSDFSLKLSHAVDIWKPLCSPNSESDSTTWALTDGLPSERILKALRLPPNRPMFHFSPSISSSSSCCCCSYLPSHSPTPFFCCLILASTMAHSFKNSLSCCRVMLFVFACSPPQLLFPLPPSPFFPSSIFSFFSTISSSFCSILSSSVSSSTVSICFVASVFLFIV